MTTQEPHPALIRCTLLMDALRDGIVLVDADGIVQLINKSARAMYLGGDTPLVGYPLSDFNDADWVEVKRVLASGVPLEMQRMTLPAAEVLVHRAPLFTQGRITGVLCALHCLTDSNAGIRHLPSFQSMMQDFEALIALPDTGVLVMDAQGHIRQVNAVFETWSGKSREALLGLPLSSLGDDILGALAALLDCLETSGVAVRHGVSVDGRPVCCVATPAYAEGAPRFTLLRVLDCAATRKLCVPAGESPASTDSAADFGMISMSLDAVEDTPLAQARSMGIVVKSRVMQQLVQKMDRVGQTESSVLLQGESGVGKSVFAAFIHKLSRRAAKPFVAINCGAIPESLMESELFGYERGAFTGADPKGRIGLLESGHGGTVFLDEIGELPMPMQVKILEALDKKSFMRVGGTRRIKVDIRIMAATNRTLEDEVHKGNFRKDLYYRLKVIPLTIPPLRERPEDIVAMTVEYLVRHNARQNEKKRLTPEVMNLLARHPFYGNMRELLNTLEWLVVMSEGSTLTAREMPTSFHADMAPRTLPGMPDSTPPETDFSGLSLKDAVQQVERRCIEQALARHGTLFEAAQSLGVHPTTLWRKMAQLQMTQEKMP